ncbi:MAG: GIY-YIG nuclease family protein [Patescibacteria group bacterium]
MKYFVYILECSDKTLYTGCTNNVPARVQRHNQGRGARYTRARLPVRILHSETYRTLASARKREAEIHRWPREKKFKLIQTKKTN